MNTPGGRVESPIVNKAFHKKRQLKTSRQAIYWAILNVCFAVFLFSEIAYEHVGTSLNISHPFLKTVEQILAILFALNIVIHLLRYIWPKLYACPVEISAAQRMLLGIRDTDPGFKLSPQRPRSHDSLEHSMLFSTSLNQSGLSSASGSPTSSRGSPSSFSLYRTTASSPGYNQSMMSNQSFGHGGANLSANMSGLNASMSSPGFVSMGPEWHNTSGLRSRSLSRTSPLRGSPGTSSNRIKDENSLNEYLREQEEKAQLTMLDATSSSQSSFWNFGRTVTDYTHVLQKYQYQLATRSPQSMMSHGHDDSGQDISFQGQEIWSKLGVTEADCLLWIENIRKWMRLTIVLKLSTEITTVNECLSRIGCEDMQVGEVSIATLKQLALTKGHYVPTLNNIIPFLDVSSNQEYLVKRIHELAKGGCMSDFDWNGGGNYGKPWGEHLPTDSALVIHFLSTYMDSRLPVDPKFPDGKTFTSQYILKTPAKPNLSKDDTLQIYQAKMNPPHFDVIIGKDVWGLPKGRNNLFNAILLFLYQIQHREHGMLGRVNMGLSGINVLWILQLRAR